MISGFVWTLSKAQDSNKQWSPSHDYKCQPVGIWTFSFGSKFKFMSSSGRVHYNDYNCFNLNSFCACVGFCLIQIKLLKIFESEQKSVIKRKSNLNRIFDFSEIWIMSYENFGISLYLTPCTSPKPLPLPNRFIIVICIKINFIPWWSFNARQN